MCLLGRQQCRVTEANVVMPGLRGAKDAKNVETPLLLVGGALLLLLVMTYLRSQLRHKPMKQQCTGVGLNLA